MLLWPGARAAAAAIADAAAAASNDKCGGGGAAKSQLVLAGARVLELGSGTGLAGLTAAVACAVPGGPRLVEKALLTDGSARALPLLRANASAHGACAVARLRWGERAPPPSGEPGWTLVIGADVFSPEMTPRETIAAFWSTAASALGDAIEGRVLVAYSERARATTRSVLEEAARAGFGALDVLAPPSDTAVTAAAGGDATAAIALREVKLLLFRREAPLPQGALEAFAHLEGHDEAPGDGGEDDDSDYEVPFSGDVIPDVE